MKKIFVVIAVMVAFVNVAVAQPATHMEARDALGRADLAAEGAMAAFDQFLTEKQGLEAKIASAEKIAVAAASRGDARLEKKIGKKLEGMKKQLLDFNKKLEEMAGGCNAPGLDVEARKVCWEAVKAITAGGELATLGTFEKVGTPVPAEQVVQTAGVSTTTTTKYGPDARVPYKKFIRCTGGETPVCTEMIVGEPTPIPPIRFVEGRDSDTLSWILWTGGGALAGAAIGGGIGKVADPTYHGPLSWDDGGGLPGALIGAGTGAALGALMKVMTD